MLEKDSVPLTLENMGNKALRALLEKVDQKLLAEADFKETTDILVLELQKDERLLWACYEYGYDALFNLFSYTDLQERIATNTIRVRNEIIHSGQASEDSISQLNLGCGNGTQEYMLHQKLVPIHNITAMDISPEMIASAQAKYPEVNYKVHDLNINFPPFIQNHSVHIATIVNTMEFTNTPIQLLLKVNRALKDGGILITSTPKQESAKVVLNIIRYELQRRGIPSEEENVHVLANKLIKNLENPEEKRKLFVNLLCNLCFVKEGIKVKHFLEDDLQNLFHHTGFKIECTESSYAGEYVITKARKIATIHQN